MPEHRPVPTLTIADYLEGELASEVRHEYLASEVHAMVGASDAHNIVCGNLFAALHRHLAGGPCRAFMSDMKVHVRIGKDDYFYYPDILVSCRADDVARYYRERPILLVEVLSEATERIDRREKLLAYQRIEALEDYVLLAQDRRMATIFRRRDDWASRQVEGDGTLEITCLEFSVPLSQVYQGVPGLAA